jgi:nucleoside-diphosphate-sugar epimerase
MKTVLVTGGAGFIGRHCVRSLVERGFDVHAVSRRPRISDLSRVRWHAADLLDAGSVRALIDAVRPTHLLHLAWYTEHGVFWASPVNLDWVEASLTLVKAFVETGRAERVVAAGTCAEYRWESGTCVEDRTPCEPATLYGASKRGLQMILERYLAQSGVAFAWGRLFLLYGPDEPPNRLISSVTRSLLADEPALCTHGRQVRDLLYVADAADAFVTLLDVDAQGAFNIASGQPVRLADAINELGSQLGRPELIRLGALASRDEPEVLAADVTRLRALGWSPRHALRDGLKLTIDWWTDQQKLQRR